MESQDHGQLSMRPQKLLPKTWSRMSAERPAGSPHIELVSSTKQGNKTSGSGKDSRTSLETLLPRVGSSAYFTSMGELECPLGILLRLRPAGHSVTQGQAGLCLHTMPWMSPGVFHIADEPAFV